MVKVIETAKVIKFETKEDRDKRKKREDAIKRIMEAANKLHW